MILLIGRRNAVEQWMRDHRHTMRERVKHIQSEDQLRGHRPEAVKVIVVRPLDLEHYELRGAARMLGLPTEEAGGAVEAWRERFGKLAFDAYNASRGGKNHLGQPTPPWGDLPEGIREAWRDAATAVVNAND